MVEGQNVVDDVWEVLDKIKDFSEAIREGKWLGVTGKPLKDVVAIGIGGSFLGPLFVHTALRWAQQLDRSDPRFWSSSAIWRIWSFMNLTPKSEPQHLPNDSPVVSWFCQCCLIVTRLLKYINDSLDLFMALLFRSHFKWLLSLFCEMNKYLCLTVSNKSWQALVLFAGRSQRLLEEQLGAIWGFWQMWIP